MYEHIGIIEHVKTKNQMQKKLKSCTQISPLLII